MAVDFEDRRGPTLRLKADLDRCSAGLRAAWLPGGFTSAVLGIMGFSPQPSLSCINCCEAEVSLRGPSGTCTNVARRRSGPERSSHRLGQVAQRGNLSSPGTTKNKANKRLRLPANGEQPLTFFGFLPGCRSQ